MRDRTRYAQCTSMDRHEIRTARKHLGLTQKQLAEVMGYGGQAYMASVEAGTRSMSDQGQKLLQAYLSGYRPTDWPVKS